MSQTPFLVYFSPDEPAIIYSINSENSILNWQRGLASLFLFRQENAEISETDVLGKCKTKYQMDRHGLHKIKNQCQSGSVVDNKVQVPLHMFFVLFIFL